MAKVVVMGAGIGGLPAAYEMKKALNELGGDHDVTVVSNTDYFHFVPSNPWVAVGWRSKRDICIDLEPVLKNKGINFVCGQTKEIDAENNKMVLADDQVLEYDYLIIATGPRLAFELVDGFGPEANTHSICHVDHALDAFNAFEDFCKNPGPIVIGAVQGASCFGPAYEFAMILDTELCKRKIRDKVPMTFVTSEPYIGHLGLGGVGDSKGILEAEMRQRHIKWETNAKVLNIDSDKMKIETVDKHGKSEGEKEIPTKYTMMIPAFRGIPAVANVEGLCNPMGFTLANEFQQNPKYENIYSAGVCVAIPPTETTPIPCGTPKTGFMIETMVTASVHNIIRSIKGEAPKECGTWHAICLADMGNTGAIFVAMPQIPPRNHQWMKKGKWVHLAKIAFEKYFMNKMQKGVPERMFEKYLLDSLGIKRLK